ncbi:MAG: uracil phosphoribosyltransferase, partial [Streptococcus mitis]|nr:uracil phosphoribosyltransferase [Streptococcus mitis]
MGKIEVINHPLIQHKLSILRRTDTSTKAFRELVDEIAMLMGYEVLRDLPLEDVEIETPITKTVQKQLAGKKLAIVPILRAGIGMVDGLLSLVPAAKVGHIGMYRDEETLQPVEYLVKLPEDIDQRQIFV